MTTPTPDYVHLLKLCAEDEPTASEQSSFVTQQLHNQLTIAWGKFQSDWIQMETSNFFFFPVCLSILHKRDQKKIPSFIWLGVPKSWTVSNSEEVEYINSLDSILLSDYALALGVIQNNFLFVCFLSFCLFASFSP
jgi:hypothetical protein